MVLFLFLPYLMKIHAKTHNFWNKKLLLSTAYLWLSTLKQLLTQNFQRVTTT